VDGIVVPLGDPAGIADAMVRMTGSAEAYERFARAALEAATRYPSWQEVTENYLELYGRLGAPA
jgi:glycosyltransferase involved in cell wall biosynthesis